MKYANLCLDNNLKMVNLGDYFQLLAIQNLYEYMGIIDVVRIPISQISAYNGEEVILPINFPFYGFYDISEKIYPIYLGISIMSNKVSAGLRFEDYQPIGCRDLHTYKEISKLGIRCYMGGCLTLAFERKKEINHNNKKTYLVDIPNSLYEYVPNSIMQNSVERTQVFYNDNCIDEKEAEELLHEYEEYASLVITSRIHCAMPCLALGIPVIFVCEFKSFRYQVLENLIPIYTQEKFCSINWNPSIINIEDRKKLILEHGADRLRSTLYQINRQRKLTEIFYGNSKSTFKIDTVSVIEEYIKRKFNSESNFEYIIWGVTQIAELVYERISEQYPKSKLVGVIDMYRKVTFHNIQSTGPELLINCKRIVFVTAGAANPIAKEILRKYNIKEYLLSYNGMTIEDGNEKKF